MDEVGQRLKEAVPSLSRSDGMFLALLAINQPLTISSWCLLCQKVGIRESSARALSTTTLRPHVESLTSRGFVSLDRQGMYVCTFPSRTVVLRWAASRPEFASLTPSFSNMYRGAVFDARIAVHRGAKDALETFNRLADRSLDEAQMLALEVTTPFDEAWLFALPGPLRDLLVELSMIALERWAISGGGPYRFIADDMNRLRELQPATITAFAGVAVLRGDRKLLGALAAHPRGRFLALPIATAVAIMEGRHDGAAVVAESTAELKRADHFGVLALLVVAALRLRRPVSERISRLVALGSRKGSPFEVTFKIYQAILRSDALQDAVQVRRSRDAASDCLENLWLGLQCVSSKHHFDMLRLSEVLMRDAKSFASGPWRWLREQSHLGASVLFDLASQEERQWSGALLQPPPVFDGPTIGPSLLTARSERPAWVIALDRLDDLAAKTTVPTETAAPSVSERIGWRANSRHGTIEPFIQKRNASGKWTSGRKLAIKHLFGKTPTIANLPEEDLRIAKHACEERSSRFGYPTVEHSIDRSAWLSLVGHPRVFIDESDVPSHVVRGAPKISATSQGDRVTVAVDPPGLSQSIEIRNTGGQIIVYQLDKTLLGILGVLAKAIDVPPEGKDRLLALLERIAALVSIESSEQTNAKTVMADAKPCFRLTPSQCGLSVALVVRPLGVSGPSVDPGRGSPTLLAAVGGETAQAERNLALERDLAASAIQACPILADAEAGNHRWFLAEPEDCLELVSSLHALADKVSLEWPHGTPLRLRSRLSRSSLRGRLRREDNWFTLEASLTVDGELSLELTELLELVAQHPGRFVKLASGEYIELEQELRDVLDNLAAARVEANPTKHRVALPTSAISVLSLLTDEALAVTCDTKSEAWREQFSSVFNKRLPIPKGLEGDLRDYQVEGFRWLARLAELELGACLADDMGLGKTVQLIALLLQRASGGPALVVAPTSVCENWRREIERFAPSLTVRVYAGNDRDAALERLGRRDIVVTSYALLQQEAESLQGIDWNTAVLDEAQLIKNPDTQRAKAAFGLRAKSRIVATGTPVENHAGDLYSLFHYLNPGLLGSWKSFAARMNADSATQTRAQKRLIQPFVLRRTKAQVLDDLPPMTEIQRSVLMSPGEAKLYESVRRAALAKISNGVTGGQARIQIFAELTRLRRLCCHPALVAPGTTLTSSKLESFIELASELVSGKHRALVFSQFTDVLALVKPLLDAKKIGYQYLDGSTPTRERSAAVDAFQAGEGDVFLISLKAGGFGLNLTAADYVIHLDPWWNPAVEAQAGGRAHRMGQTRPVTVYRLVTEGTIEARIVELHREKRDLADALLAETDRAGKLSAQELRSLLDGP